MSKLDYYPIVTSKKTPQGLVLKTRIRKQHTDGIWYTFDVIQYTIFDFDGKLDIDAAYARFIKGCYMGLAFTTIQPELKNPHDMTGNPYLYPKDELQISEGERLLTKN